jgi:serralysin
MLKFRSVALLAGVTLLGVGCGGSEEMTQEKAPMSWEEFKASAIASENNVFVVDGDTALEGEEGLRNFYENHVAADLGRTEGGPARSG